MDSQPRINALSIDVEDYFQVSAFEAVSPPDTWEQRQLRVDHNTRRILEILSFAGVKATFFILGWVAERCPRLVRQIAAEGHEVASHGYGHQRVYKQSREEFRHDVRRSKTLLEDLIGDVVYGYRAPSYSISHNTLWAFDELVDAGYSYDSSIFPIRHDFYGMSDWPRFPFCVERLEGGNWVPTEAKSRCSASQVPRATPEESSTSASGRDHVEPGTWTSERLLELPITTLRLFGKNLPIAGGGYFRLLPYWLTRWGLARINRRDGRSFVFYLHPWEMDPDQPRIPGASLRSRFRHYINLKRTEKRFHRLLEDFSFSSVRDCMLSQSLATGSLRLCDD